MPAMFKQTAAHSAASNRSSARQDSRVQLVRGGAGRGNKSGAGQSEAKGQGDGDPAKGDGTVAHLTEVDREWFNIKIQDLEDKLARSFS